MADYASLAAAIAAGDSNMTVLRNNSRTTGTSTYATGITWFKFNKQTVANIYSNGTSYLSIYSNSASYRLSVNAATGAVWYEYKETGTINGYQFFRFRWVGAKTSASTAISDPRYQQGWEVFFLDTGQIYLNFFDVPELNATGTCQLRCSSEYAYFTIAADTPCEFTFTPSDPDNGTGWTVAAGRPELPRYELSGSAEYAFTSIRELTGAFSGYARWSQDTPDGTDVTVEAKLDNGAWQTLTNGADLPINWSAITTTSTLYIRITLETENQKITPSFAGLQIVAFDQVSKRFAVLTFPSGNVNSFRNAVGDITLTYDGAGELEGEGGPVQEFEETFTPVDLIPKHNPNDVEHIELNLIAAGTLTRIYYTDAQEREHISLAVSASGVLTHVDDL